MITSRLNGKGLTIIELVVAILLIVIIMTPLVFLFGSTVRGFFAGRPPMDVMKVLNEALIDLCDNLRESNGITNATASSVTFLDKTNVSVIFRWNSTSQVIEMEKGLVTTYIPYYNTPTSPDKINLSLNYSYLEGNNTSWGGVNTTTISAVILNLSGNYQSYSLNFNGRVTLRKKI